jgi:hypothetical protein
VLLRLGPEEVVFDWRNDRCADLDVPDVYAKAVRRDSEIVLVSGNAPDNYWSFGPDLDSVVRDCEPVLRSADGWDAASFANQEWITSVWTDDGETIHALVHNEFHDPVADTCLPGVTDPSNPCWYNAITYAVSVDGGHSFEVPSSPGHLVAPPPAVWDPTGGPRGGRPPPFGYMEPSNVVTGPDGASYSMFFALTDYTDGAETGTCVMRNESPADPAGWRLWDGDGFDIEPTDPYEAPAPPCAFVGEAEIDGLRGSLTWNAWFGRFLLVGASAAWIDGALVCGFFYSTSEDLIDWEPQRLLKAGSLPWDACFSGFGVDVYPSIIDPDDTTRTFERSGQQPWLYFTRMNEWGLDRDMLRLRVSFDVE